MHNAMPNGGQSFAPAALLDPFHQGVHRGRVIRRLYEPRKVIRFAHTFHPQRGFRLSNPFDPALQHPPQRVTNLEERKLDARGTAIDRQDA